MKLIYFSARGRAEPARLMLELTGTSYEYEAISVETWMTPECQEGILSCTPFGKLPRLEDGAFSLCQSLAINRYLARKLGLYGATLEEGARIDEVAECADEFIMDMAQFHWNPQFHELRAGHRESMGKKLDLLEKYFTRTAADAEHWVLPDRYTLADVVMAYALETLMPTHPGLVKDFPKLEHAMNAFFAADGVREYVRSDRRPRTWTISMATFAGVPEETHHWTA